MYNYVYIYTYCYLSFFDEFSPMFSYANYVLPPFQGMVERLKEAAALADEKEKSLGASDENCGSVSDFGDLGGLLLDVHRCSMYFHCGNHVFFGMFYDFLSVVQVSGRFVSRCFG